MARGDDASSKEFLPPPEIDTTVASNARVYDAMLDGKDNYEVDRVVRDQLIDAAPNIQNVTRDNREWLIRVTRFLAGEAGIGQFIDCGSGLPSTENTHQVVQRLDREAQVVYVDNDPIVLAHGRALLEENDRTHFCPADFTCPDELLVDPVVTKYIDWDEPIALLQLATMHHLADAELPHNVMAAYVDALPSGSYVALSHFYDPADGSELADLAQRLEKILLTSTMASGRFRTHDEIAAFFDGLELLPPGLTCLADWWPDGPRSGPLPDVQRLILGGLGRKP
jgi:hypothetical protein